MSVRMGRAALACGVAMIMALSAPDAMASVSGGATAATAHGERTLSGMRVLILGDSISDPDWKGYAETNWVSQLCDSGFLDRSKVTDDARSGHGFSKATLGDGRVRVPLAERIRQHASEDYDLVVFHIGTNDFGHSIPMSTFERDVDGCFDYARSTFNGARFAVITPLRRANMGNRNGEGLTLHDYSAYIESAAKANGWDVIDMTDYGGFDPAFPEFARDMTRQGDGLHPSAAATGEEIIPVVRPWLLSVMGIDDGRYHPPLLRPAAHAICDQKTYTVGRTPRFEASMAIDGAAGASSDAKAAPGEAVTLSASYTLTDGDAGDIAATMDLGGLRRMSEAKAVLTHDGRGVEIPVSCSVAHGVATLVPESDVECSEGDSVTFSLAARVPDNAPSGRRYVVGAHLDANADAPDVRAAVTADEIHRVTFVTSRGTAPGTQLVRGGAQADEPDMADVDGHRLAGWSTDAEGGDRYDWASPVTGDVTLYAVWEAVPGTEPGHVAALSGMSFSERLDALLSGITELLG